MRYRAFLLLQDILSCPFTQLFAFSKTLWKRASNTSAFRIRIGEKQCMWKALTKHMVHSEGLGSVVLACSLPQEYKEKNPLCYSSKIWRGKEKKLFLKGTQRYTDYSLSQGDRVHRDPAQNPNARMCLMIGGELNKLWHSCSTVYSIPSNDLYNELYHTWKNTYSTMSYTHKKIENLFYFLNTII